MLLRRSSRRAVRLPRRTRPPQPLLMASAATTCAAGPGLVKVAITIPVAKLPAVTGDAVCAPGSPALSGMPAALVSAAYASITGSATTPARTPWRRTFRVLRRELVDDRACAVDVMLMVFSLVVGGAARHRFVCWSELIAVSRHRGAAPVAMEAVDRDEGGMSRMGGVLRLIRNSSIAERNPQGGPT
jgi:hypothetical protein